MTTSSCFRVRIGLLLIAGVNLASTLAAAPTSLAVTQAWSARLDGPTNSYFETRGISIGPSGDVFVVGQANRSNVNYDIVVSRYDSSGNQLWKSVFEPEDGPAGHERAAGIVVWGTDVYVAGMTTGGGGSQDFLTLKYNSTGQLQWADRLDGAGHSTDACRAVAVDSLGNLLVAGDSIGTNGSSDIVVLKYDPFGNLLWKYSYDGPEQGPDRAAGIRLGLSGSVYVAGTSQEGRPEASIITFKLDADGQEEWVARETSTDLYGFYGLASRSFDVDAAGNVVTVASEKSHGVTWKYDANGNRQWTARYRAEEPASVYAWTVRFDGSGNIIAAANLYGSGTNDAVLIKYAADGQQLWATRIADPDGVAHIQALALDGNGNVYLSTAPRSDVVTFKVGPDGTQLWSITYNSTGLFTDYAQFMQVAPPGDIFVASRSIHFSESFSSLVKYSQQSVTGIVTAVVTPALQVVDPGSNVLFTTETSGPGPIRFQWRMNGRALPAATNATLVLTNVQVFHRGDYSVVVSNSAGGTVSPEARLSVKTRPEVSIVPTQTVAYVGVNTAFFAMLSGNDFVALQWRHNGTNIPGATNAVLELVNLSGASAGAYDVVASTLGGTTTSSAAGLRISGAIELLGLTRHRSSPSSWDYAPQFRVLANGEFLIAARSNHLNQSSSILLRKHDSEGALLWSTLFAPPDFTNAEPTHLALDAAGNIYVAGQFRQPYITVALVVLKYSPAGQLLWSRILTGTNLWGSIHPFAVDPDGNSTLGIKGGHGTNVIQMVRYNTSGDLQWSYVDPSPDIDTIAVAVDASGNSYLGTTIPMGDTNEIRLLKFDSDGTTVWTNTYAEGMYNRLGAITADSSGNLIVTGTGALDVPDSWMFVQKYSPAGQKLWETRTGGSWSEISYIVTVAAGPGDEITVLTMSDDDYIVEQSGLTRLASNGQLRYRIGEPLLLVGRPSQLALDGFGNAYVTGNGSVTAKFDPNGTRLWMVSHDVRPWTWQYGLALGIDAAGDVRVLTMGDTISDIVADFSVLRYRQRDPAGILRVRLIPTAAGTFHLDAPSGESFQIEASTDLQNWNVLEAAETQQLLQPGGTIFSGSPRRFFRLIFTE